MPRDLLRLKPDETTIRRLRPILSVPQFGHQDRHILVFLECRNFAIPHGKGVRPSQLEDLARRVDATAGESLTLA